MQCYLLPTESYWCTVVSYLAATSVVVYLGLPQQFELNSQAGVQSSKESVETLLNAG